MRSYLLKKEGFNKQIVIKLKLKAGARFRPLKSNWKTNVVSRKIKERHGRGPSIILLFLSLLPSHFLVFAVLRLPLCLHFPLAFTDSLSQFDSSPASSSFRPVNYLPAEFGKAGTKILNREREIERGRGRRWNPLYPLPFT